jgi:Flp pilus assembly protein TadG
MAINERRRLRTSQKGQGLVEFAIMLPALLLLIMALIEFGRLMVALSAVSSASREAARYAASSGDNGSGVAHFRDCTGMRDAVDRLNLFNSPVVTIQYDLDGPGGLDPVGYCPLGTPSEDVSLDLGSQIIVTVATIYQPMVPLLEMPPIPVVSKTSRTLLMNVYVND